ncbi:tRNA lysidine(34) synthetase TilS [Myroides fluvii]|uniref:tRNA lysidine(34) synthetase TilS n=1 Tax=Myroides fluvii TaxID=2572594 RepID=UPI00131D62B0|nr:tRNA lysidine(34) synthetase TilS [Myroides fluvii]
MENKFKKHIESNFTELTQYPLLIAVSGGVDSVVLLHLCHRIGLHVAVAHCNFNLRAEDSNLDQQFVTELSAKLKLPFFVKEFDTQRYAVENKVSIQVAAREQRYQWFEEILKLESYSYLLTAHHLDDSMETFFINFSRGTGLEGLLGIPEKTTYIRRPLLVFTREEIEQYAQANQIVWREDYTNAQTKYLRNKIRKNILPVFKEINPQIDQTFQQTIGFLKEAHQMREDASRMMFEKVVLKQGDDLLFPLKELSELSLPKAYLYKWLEPYGFKAWNDIAELEKAETGKKILAEHYCLIKDRGYLLLRLKSKIVEESEDTVYLQENQTITQPIHLTTTNYDRNKIELTTDPLCAYLDRDKLQFPLLIRKPKKGDYFVPFGMKGTKRISKYVKDEKMTQIEKENIWLLCSGDTIVWIIGNRMDERFKVRNTTTNVLKIKLTV